MPLPGFDLLAHATAFRIPIYPEGHQFPDIAAQAVTVEWRGDDCWAVIVQGSCFDARGRREYEPSPSSRGPDFLARFRFTRDEAIRIAREVVVPNERQRWEKLLARKGMRKGNSAGAR